MKILWYFIKNSRLTTLKWKNGRVITKKTDAQYDLTKCENNGSKTHLNQVYKYSKNYNPELVYPKSIVRFVRDRNKKDVAHPTQKPLALLEYLVKTYSNEGDLILDNCAGSGTTLLAAKNLNRQFIGIEKEPKYYEIIKNRLT